ncbi:cell division protein ZapA [Venatoribacter cucullus]|uniref:Cell division protein ZapA n=1 Tax=Venatoribacter cucullus TaxID=2661630 RepID=A0A9E8FJN4_9GAMM|nr:cell division protein ZapA [Venatoribacter cucullus]QQD20322.1 cell division protein ZapA [Oceanospirillaceae bacterium ASx5O]QQD23036.1 cell division protein ZapA [Venatoribacter cucullus]UZK02470.1 cell division protein ZapA [Venatoribacter cucullus]
MADSPKTLSLNILDREYRINCPVGAEEKLRDAARMLNEKMSEIKSAGAASGKVLGTDRIAVIAALNIAHQLREQEGQQQDLSKDLARMHQLLDDALAQDLQLEL